jgi:hypothetical protein
MHGTHLNGVCRFYSWFVSVYGWVVVLLTGKVLFIDNFDL